MAYRLPKIINKTFVNYATESETELKELKKLKIMVSSGSTKERKVTVSIDKPKVIEVRIYNLNNFAIGVYHDFNRKVKKLIK